MDTFARDRLPSVEAWPDLLLRWGATHGFFKTA